MEFENVNNINLAIEAALAKKSGLVKAPKKKTSIFTAAVHRLKKMLRRAKPECSCVPAKSEEEMENDLNEMLEAKNRQLQNISQIQYVLIDGDLRPFQTFTLRQTPQAQVPW